MYQTKRYLTVGVVGLGSMGQNHVRIAANHPSVRAVHVYDTDTIRAENVSQRFDCEIAPSYEALLEKVDAVVIASSTLSHFTLAQAALEAKVHCLIEKPIAATIDEAAQIVSLASKNGCAVAVGHVERYNPVFQELAKILKSETVLAVRAERLSYNLSRANDVTVVLDLMVHDLDTIMQIAQSELKVEHAVGAAFRSVELDYVAALLSDHDGVLYSVTASKVSQTRVRQLSVSCENCFIEADYLKKEIQIFRNASGKYLERSQEIGYRQEALVERVLVPNTEPLMAEHSDFYAAILNGTPPQVSAMHGLRALQLAETVEQAVAQSHGKTVGCLAAQ